MLGELGVYYKNEIESLSLIQHKNQFQIYERLQI